MVNARYLSNANRSTTYYLKLNKIQKHEGKPMNKIGYGISILLVAKISFWTGVYYAKLQNETLVNAGINSDITVNNQSIEPKPIAMPTSSELAQVTATDEIDQKEGSENLELVALKQLLARTNQVFKQISSDIAKYQFKYERAKAMLKAAGIEVPDEEPISQEALAELPAPFDSVLTHASPNIKSAFNELHKQEQDFDWAIQFETRVSDFFAVHENSPLVTLSKITCKTNKCELYGFQDDPAALQKIMQDLNKEAWFMAVNTNSMTGDSFPNPDLESPNNPNVDDVEKPRAYFYILVSILRAE